MDSCVFQLFPLSNSLYTNYITCWQICKYLLPCFDCNKTHDVTGFHCMFFLLIIVRHCGGKCVLHSHRLCRQLENEVDSVMFSVFVPDGFAVSCRCCFLHKVVWMCKRAYFALTELMEIHCVESLFAESTPVCLFTVSGHELCTHAKHLIFLVAIVVT